MKLRPFRAEFFDEDGDRRKDTTKPIVAFSKLSEHALKRAKP
jgi:hypothetical protein